MEKTSRFLLLDQGSGSGQPVHETWKTMRHEKYENIQICTFVLLNLKSRTLQKDCLRLTLI